MIPSRVAGLCALLIAVILTGCVSPQASRALSDAGVAAYLAGEDDEAWARFSPLAARGDFRAQRYMARMLMDGRAPRAAAARLCEEPTCAGAAHRLLIDAAARGDNNSLVLLEELAVGGGAFAPPRAEIIALETARAARGDPVMAWRLARRVRDGELAPPPGHYAAWLKTVASADKTGFPHARDAAFLLCEAHARGDHARKDVSEAIKWCRRAGKAGHHGAVAALAVLRGLGD